jgi:hypothetical protein
VIPAISSALNHLELVLNGQRCGVADDYGSGRMILISNGAWCSDGPEEISFDQTP